MKELFDRVEALYPRVAQRCLEISAIRLAEEIVRLKNGESHWLGEEDILSGLAQAVRESRVDLSEMANECGIELLELRRKLALSRLDELLKPGEVSELSDSVLESKLQQAAAEYNLGVDEVLHESPLPSPLAPCAVETFAPNSRRDRVPHSPRCRICRWLRLQSYRIDFKPDMLGGFFIAREPSYACDHCIRAYLANRQVQQIERLTESEIPKSPNLRTWTAAFSAIAMVVLSGLYIFRSDVIQMAQLLQHGASQNEVARRLGLDGQAANHRVPQVENEKPTGLTPEQERPGP